MTSGVKEASGKTANHKNETNLPVPKNTDISLSQQEFENIKMWAIIKLNGSQYL
jgi:hypothetical protein